jgi:hypothetical protein
MQRCKDAKMQRCKDAKMQIVDKFANAEKYVSKSFASIPIIKLSH